MPETKRTNSWIDGYRILVVGARGGMGKALRRRLAAQGSRVLSADVASGPGDDFGIAVDELIMDLRDEDQVVRQLAAAEKMLGGLDALVNCAGVLGPIRDSTQVTVDEFNSILQVNLLGAFTLMRAALPGMIAAGSGRIVQVASIAGKEGNPQMAAYSASKAALIGMVKAMGREFATTGVTINAIAPAIIDTPLISAMTAARRSVQVGLVPMSRMGSAEEAAALMEYILSPEASFTTGFVYDLSGGRASY